MEISNAVIEKKEKGGFILNVNVFLSKNGYNIQDYKITSNNKEYDVEINIGKNPNTSTRNIDCKIDISKRWFTKGTIFNITVTQEKKNPRKRKLIAQHSNDNIKPGSDNIEDILSPDMIH